jgi:hypothetical protein
MEVQSGKSVEAQDLDSVATDILVVTGLLHDFGRPFRPCRAWVRFSDWSSCMTEGLEFIEPGSSRQGFGEYLRARIHAGEKFPELGATVYRKGWVQALNSARERLAEFDDADRVLAVLDDLMKLDQ